MTKANAPSSLLTFSMCSAVLKLEGEEINARYCQYSEAGTGELEGTERDAVFRRRIEQSQRDEKKRQPFEYVDVKELEYGPGAGQSKNAPANLSIFRYMDNSVRWG